MHAVLVSSCFRPGQLLWLMVLLVSSHHEHCRRNAVLLSNQALPTHRLVSVSVGVGVHMCVFVVGGGGCGLVCVHIHILPLPGYDL